MASFARNGLVRAAAGAVPLLCSVVLNLGAQQVRRAGGVVQRANGADVQPIAGAWVVLHRVGHDKAGPVDSVRSDASGRFNFRYTRTGDSAVYFASSMYSGVAYFTSPFPAADEDAVGAELTVFDTTSTGIQPATRSRHIVVFVPDDRGMRRVSEVFWIENTGTRTHVPAGSLPSWQSVLPTGTVDMKVDDGDVADQAVVVHDNRLQVFAPFSPGLRTLQISYQLPAATFPIKVPVTDSVSVLELLVEDPAARAVGAGLVAQPAVSVSQRSFQRFLARDVAAGASFELSIPRARRVTRGVYVAAIVGVAALALLVGFSRLMATPPPIPLPGRPVPKRADELAHAIADLDARFARNKAPSEAERAAYAARRESLKEELAAVLAERDDQL